MMKKSLALILLLGIAGPVTALADDDSLVKFKGGIGVTPVSSGQGTATTATIVNRNIVRGVQPPGQIWIIRNLKADVKVDGRIRVNGRGLLLGGGNNIGFNANQSVFASLICGAAAPFTVHSSTLTGVPIVANGDFRINDQLTDVPPGPCVNPVLLIRSATNQSWFAAGIVQSGERDDD